MRASACQVTVSNLRLKEALEWARSTPTFVPYLLAITEKSGKTRYAVVRILDTIADPAPVELETNLGLVIRADTIQSKHPGPVGSCVKQIIAMTPVL